jgi:hypothetical protein
MNLKLELSVSAFVQQTGLRRLKRLAREKNTADYFPGMERTNKVL